jgi:hypothetical protein
MTMAKNVPKGKTRRLKIEQAARQGDTKHLAKAHKRAQFKNEEARQNRLRREEEQR